MDITVERLTPARVADYLAFFDHERGPAFADNSEWAKCYCHYYELSPALDWPTFTGDMNRTAIKARIETGEMEGYLAYAAGEVVGWMNAQPYSKLPHACARMRIPAPSLPVPTHDAAAIVCFVVAPAHRGHGVARALLAAGLANLALRGVTVIDAFPWNTEPGATDPKDFYHGSRRMFEEAGFAEIATHENVTVMRKVVA